MKKSISFLLVLVLLCQAFIFTGCKDETEVSMETLLNENYTIILGGLQNAQSLADIQSYLIKWAGNNDIKVSHDDCNNVIMSAKATEGYEDAESTVLQCTLSLDAPEKTAAAVAIMQYIIKYSQAHGFIRLIFTADEGNTHEGIRNIKKAYLSGDNLISLDYDAENSLLIGSAGSETYTITDRIKRQSPSYAKAYKISIQNLTGAAVSDASSHPNPITVIGDLLASAKSNGILLEIASFTGGSDTDHYPSGAEAIVLINQNDINRLTRMVEKNQTKLRDKYSEQEPDLTYDFVETEMPESVLSFDDSSNLIGFLYACINGTYLKNDEGEVIAKSNIGTISTEGNELKITIGARSKSSAVLEEMNLLFETVCGLCELSYTVDTSYPVWESNATLSYNEDSTIEEDTDFSANPLVLSLTACMEEISGDDVRYERTLDYTACAVAVQRNPSLNAVCFGVTKDKMTEQTTILMNYLSRK